MSWIVTKIKWIMLVSGVLTCTMIYAFIAPQAALQANFGASIDGPLVQIVVRNWGALITLVGAMLIYGAYVPVHRRLILTVASVSKVIFISLILIHGNQFLSVAAPALVFDTLVVILYVMFLISSRDGKASS